MSANPKFEFSILMLSSEIILRERALRKYVHIVYMCEKLFSQAESMNVALAFLAHFLLLNGTSHVLEKNFPYLPLHLYIHITYTPPIYIGRKG